MPAESLTHIPATFLQKIRLDGFCRSPPARTRWSSQPLNVLIGANASGKSNLIGAFQLLRALPTNFADAIREGGGAEWIWKGEGGRRSAEIEAEVKVRAGKRPLRHRLAFTAVSQERPVGAPAKASARNVGGPFSIAREDRGRDHGEARYVLQDRLLAVAHTQRGARLRIISTGSLRQAQKIVPRSRSVY
jgi:predicted ATPase